MCAFINGDLSSTDEPTVGHFIIIIVLESVHFKKFWFERHARSWNIQDFLILLARIHSCKDHILLMQIQPHIFVTKKLLVLLAEEKKNLYFYDWLVLYSWLCGKLW